MKIYISKQIMQSNGKRAVNGIAAVLFLLLLSALTFVNAYQVGDTFRDCEVCPEMVVLPAGKFMMGSPEGERGRWISEGPQHQVTISQPFAVGKYEVTVGQYTAFGEEAGHITGRCDFPEESWDPIRLSQTNNHLGESWNNSRFDQTNNHPVTCVSWYDASTYAVWLSVKTGYEYRLLSEAEWEYAARAGTTTAYYFGRMILGDIAQHIRDTTAAVGSFPANAFGLHDMHGNVSEWVEDCSHVGYVGAPTNGSSWLSGCYDAQRRGLRGGSWDDRPGGLRSANRNWFNAPDRRNTNGFRVARDFTP